MLGGPPTATGKRERLPELSGPAAAQQIRKIRPEIPLAFYTGYSKDEMIDEMRQLQNYKLISKPCHVAEVSQMISTMLKS